MISSFKFIFALRTFLCFRLATTNRQTARKLIPKAYTYIYIYIYIYEVKVNKIDDNSAR